MDKSIVMRNYRLLVLMLFAVVASCVAGRFFPKFGYFIRPAGIMFINIVLCVVVSLVSASISNSAANVRSRKRVGKTMSTTVLTLVVIGTVAAVIMFIVMKLVSPVLEPWTDIATEAISERASLTDTIVNFSITGGFIGLLNHSAMLPLIVFPILFGSTTNLMGGPDHIIDKFLDGLTEVMMAFVKIIAYYVPIALFALSADLVTTYGSSVVFTYGRAMTVYYPLCFIYIFTASPLFVYVGGGRYGIKTILQHTARPAIMSSGACSSSATISANLYKAKDVDTPKDVADMVVPTGVIMHMDSSRFSCVLKIAFVLEIVGVDISRIMFPTVVTVVVLSSAGMPDIPGGGYIGEYTICPIFLPQRIGVASSILMAISSLVDPPATMINSVGDYVVCYIVARVTDGKDWLDRATAARHTKQHPPGAPCGAGYLPEKQKGNEA